MSKSFYCWQCKYFNPENQMLLRSGYCHRFAPRTLDYFGLPSVSIIASAEDDSESSTTSTSFVEKLSLVFEAVDGIQYDIEWYFEMYAITGEDINAIVEINGSDVICDSTFKAFTYAADKWNDGTGGFKLISSLSGTTTIKILYKNQYGTGPQKIRRARLKVKSLSSSGISSTKKYCYIFDGGPGMWCGQFRITNKSIPPIPPPIP